MPLTCIVHPFSTAPNGLLTSLVALVQPSGFTVRAGDIMYTYLSAETLERQTRPYLSNTVPQIQAHGGHFDIEDVDEATGDVTIAIGGACSGCEIAPMTMRAIRDRLPSDVDGITTVTARRAGGPRAAADYPACAALLSVGPSRYHLPCG